MTWPFENDTSTIVKKLANRSIQADKRRNVFIIVTIALAACLMTTLALYTFGKSYEAKTFLQGRYQAAVIGIDPQMVTILSNDANIEMAGMEVALDSFRIEDYTLNINYRDSNDLYLRSIEMNGRLPETENEVAVSSSFLEHTGYSVSLNEKIVLPLKNGETEYIVCGIINDDGSNRNYQILVSDAFLKSYYAGSIPYVGIFRIMASEHFSHEELKTTICSCLGNYGIEENQIAFSSSYFDTADNSSRDMLIVLAISVLIVIACSMVIYSLFYISVIGKIKEYGRFQVIGMTKKQIKKMIWKESRKLSLLSIPAGCVLGCVLGYALVPKGWYWPNSIMGILGVTVITELAVMISINKPVKIAASVSPIEAIRITTTTDTAKEMTTKKLVRNLSPMNLAKLNFMRNRKKVVMTLISLGFTGILLMCGATYFCSVYENKIARQMFGEKEITISLSPNDNSTQQISRVTSMTHLQENNPLSDELVNELLKCKEITEIKEVQGVYAAIFLPGNAGTESSMDEMIGALSREQIANHNSCLLSGTMDYNTLVEGYGILVDDNENNLAKFYGYDLKLGDQIEILSDMGEKITFTIAGTVDFGNEYNGNLFFLPTDLIKVLRSKVTNFNTQLSIRTDLQELPLAEQFVFDTLSGKQDLVIESYTDVLAFAQKSLKAYTAPIYGLVIFIGLFGIINLINTLMTNLISRQQEFGVLQSIGLTGKQLAKMLQIESLYYVFGTMIITLTVGTVSGYCLCLLFDQIGVFGKLHYTFPIVQIIIFFVALFAVAMGYSLLAIRYCKKQSLVDRIKTME